MLHNHVIPVGQVLIAQPAAVGAFFYIRNHAAACRANGGAGFHFKIKGYHVPVRMGGVIALHHYLAGAGLIGQQVNKAGIFMGTAFHIITGYGLRHGKQRAQGDAGEYGLLKTGQGNKVKAPPGYYKYAMGTDDVTGAGVGGSGQMLCTGNWPVRPLAREANVGACRQRQVQMGGRIKNPGSTGAVYCC